MIEAVGWKDFGTFFARCSDLLAPHGLMLLQAITIDDRAYHVEKGNRSFIATYIFPGGCLPSSEIIARCVSRRTDLHAVGLQDITADYAETLRHWRRRFLARAGRASPRWATTSASGACGTSTSPTARPASASGASATCSCCWPSRAGAATSPRRRPPRPRSPPRRRRTRPPSRRSSKLPELGAEVSGSGAPLLLVHGIGGTRRIWDPVVAPLAGDVRGHRGRPAGLRRVARRSRTARRPTRPRSRAPSPTTSTRAGSRPRTSPAARWARGSRSSSRAWAARAR